MRYGKAFWEAIVIPEGFWIDGRYDHKLDLLAFRNRNTRTHH